MTDLGSKAVKRRRCRRPLPGAAGAEVYWAWVGVGPSLFILTRVHQVPAYTIHNSFRSAISLVGHFR